MGSLNTIAQAGNTHRIAKAEYEAAKMVQSANNSREAARVTLSEFTRSMSNKLRLEAAGKEFNSRARQLSEQLEARGGRRMSASLAAAEQMGAITAGAAGAGVGGSSVQLLSDTVILQREMKQGMADIATARMAQRGAASNASVMGAAASGMNFSQDFGNFDYKVHIAPKKMKNRFGAILGAAVATYFGGPAAGAAVADFAVGSWQNSNGNFAGAAQSFDRGIKGAMTGYQNWASLQGADEGPNSWFSAVTQPVNRKAQEDDGVKWGTSSYGEDFLIGPY